MIPGWGGRPHRHTAYKIAKETSLSLSSQTIQGRRKIEKGKNETLMIFSRSRSCGLMATPSPVATKMWSEMLWTIYKTMKSATLEIVELTAMSLQISTFHHLILTLSLFGWWQDQVSFGSFISSIFTRCTFLFMFFRVIFYKMCFDSA